MKNIIAKITDLAAALLAILNTPRVALSVSWNF